jgi:hypothetical protein
MRVKPAQDIGQTMNPVLRDIAIEKRHFQRLGFIEPPHHGQPINDWPAAADGVSI